MNWSSRCMGHSSLEQTAIQAAMGQWGFYEHSGCGLQAEMERQKWPAKVPNSVHQGERFLTEKGVERRNVRKWLVQSRHWSLGSPR